MKWENRGKEFDRSQKVSIFRSCENVYIYGAGEYGKDLYEKMYLLQDMITFIDSNQYKQEIGYCERPVISPNKIDEIDSSKSIIVVAASIQNTPIIEKQLCMRGLEKIVFLYAEFAQFWLPIFVKYRKDKIYFQDITILVTEKCTLKCKACAPMYPYLEQPRHRNYDELIEDIDSLFDSVDYVWDLIFTGGEPFLFPQFQKLIDYTLRKYKNKFHHVQIISNGSVLPHAEFRKLLSENKIYLSISDYTQNLQNDRLVDIIKENIAILQKDNVCIEIPKVEHWCDFGFANNIKKNLKDEDMTLFFDNCNSNCRAFHKKHFVYCVPAMYADIVLSKKEEKQWDIDNFFIPNDRMELLEWQCGYNEKGHLEMCKYCNGYLTINKKYVPVGQQL